MRINVLLYCCISCILFFSFISIVSYSDNIYLPETYRYLPADSLKETKEYLELKAIINYLKPKIKNSTSPLDSAIIKIYRDNAFLTQHYTNAKGKCNFLLPLDGKNYKVEITKKDFVTKFIEINTKVNKGKKGEFVFPFEMDLFMMAPGLDISILKQPIAKIKYNAVYNQFDYDFYYTGSMNDELKKLHENYYFLQKIDKDLKDSIPTGKKKK